MLAFWVFEVAFLKELWHKRFLSLITKAIITDLPVWHIYGIRLKQSRAFHFFSWRYNMAQVISFVSFTQNLKDESKISIIDRLSKLLKIKTERNEICKKCKRMFLKRVTIEFHVVVPLPIWKQLFLSAQVKFSF